MPLSRRAFVSLPLAAAIARPAAAQDASVDRPYWPTANWRRSRPERQGMDPGLLDEAARIIGTEMPDVTGLLVVRHGYVVQEQYFGESYGRNDPVKIRSITKSVAGTLIGIALSEGKLDSLDQTIGELIPHRIPSTADSGTPDISLRHLLTMTSGWEWDIGSDYQRLIASKNWAALTLSRPIVYEPGTFYAYNTGGSHLLSVILTTVTGQDTADYAQEKLFDHLGIERPTWQRSPQDEAVGGFGLELTARDLAKLGFLYLNDGQWDGRQIVPVDYVRAATSYQSTGDSTGYAAYGYQWWVAEVAGNPSFFGLGFGGQYLYVVPALDLIAVVIAGFETPPPVTIHRPVIENVIVPAVVGD
jgi:CubicO group peptidase (beta-lactamase class C family)